MINQLVIWRELEPVFRSMYPRTLDDVLNSGKVAMVVYWSNRFEIRPNPNLDTFEVWGPPHIFPVKEIDFVVSMQL